MKPRQIFAFLLLVCISAPLRAQSLKRGLGANSTSLTNSVNATWGYNWGASPSSGNLNGDFVPMFWSGGNWTNKFNTVAGQSNVDYILGFNEPERSDQANMTVANAISQWRTVSDEYSGTTVKLVSPAVSDTAAGRAWLDDFMTQVDNDPNLVVDEVAFHWYGPVSGNATAAANAFLNKVDQYHSNYGRKVWITEFAGIDFAGNYTTERMQEWNAEFLETALPGLESRSHVSRYAWWNHNNDSRLVTQDAYNLWRPTQVGDPYVETLKTGDTRDMNGAGLGLQMQYLRGGKVINDGVDLGNAVGRIYAMSNHDGTLATSQFGGDGDFGLQGWGSLRIEQNAKLQKEGDGTVNLRNIDIYNDGELQLLGNSGSIKISGSGTNALGTGKIRLNQSSHLQLGNAADTSGFELPYTLDLRGGKITIDGPEVRLSGNGTVVTQTFFDANHDFEITGSLGGNAGIVKQGDATMTFSVDQAYAGFTRIDEGLLLVNGELAGNNVLINNGGTLGGIGDIASMIEARSGGTVSPGDGIGALTAGAAEFQNGSTLDIQLMSISDFDRFLVDGAINVDPGTTLRLSFLDGYMPSVGDEFDVLDFTQFTGSFENVVAPTLAEGNWDFSDFSSTGSLRVTAVPEPGTLFVTSAFALAVAYRRRKTVKKQEPADANKAP